jgi:hypothetical protein
MVNQTVTLEALKGPLLEQLLQEVADRHVIVTVLLPSGKGVVIGPKPNLRPLPELEGRLPDGWKDAVYAEE